MAKKIQLQDASGNVLHPLTLGECVTMNNGENLDTLMSKSQMFTPTIAQDKSMFKVGTGVDVDYSANVKDGAYESLVFKGKSLVNLMTKVIDTTWNLNLESWCITYTTPTDLVLKPSTTYSVIIYVTEKTCSDRDDLFWVGDVDGTKNKVSNDIVRKNVSLGANVFVINTVSDFSNLSSTKGGICFQGSKFVEGTLKWKAIVLEGDWADKELPPYFTGLCDSKMPILRNVGKNLCGEINKNATFAWVKSYEWGNDVLKLTLNDGGYNAVRFPIRLSKGNYHLSASHNGQAIGFRVINDSGSRLVNPITLTKDEEMLVEFMGNGGNVEENKMVTFSDIQLEQNTTQTTYEDHKTNILCTSEEIVLREVNGVQDTYNPLTGEYVQRIGEAILDGSSDENWGRNTTLSSNTETSFFTLSVDKVKRTMGTITKKCDKMTANPDYAHVQDIEGIHQVVDNQLSVRILKNRLSSDTVEGLKQWLSQNPITVQYQLTEPVTTIVKSSTMTPFAYQNGHVIVESGFEGQSLLPEIEYSVVTGRTGQVTQNTKVLRQQEQQITSLEELLLTQIVQMEYERTLLQFDYELQMIKLG